MIEERLATAHRYFSKKLSVQERWSAKWAGRRDGAACIPSVADVRPSSRMPPGRSTHGWTPFIEIAHQSAEEAVDVLVGLVMEAERPLLGRLHSQADRVNREHDEQKMLTSESRERFLSSAGRWSANERVYEPHAQRANKHGNLVILKYWGPLMQHHPYLSGSKNQTVSLIPQLVAVNHAWPGGFGLEAISTEYPHIRRALEIVGWFGPRDPGQEGRR